MEHKGCRQIKVTYTEINMLRKAKYSLRVNGRVDDSPFFIFRHVGNPKTRLPLGLNVVVNNSGEIFRLSTNSWWPNCLFQRLCGSDIWIAFVTTLIEENGNLFIGFGTICPRKFWVSDLIIQLFNLH